MDLTIVPKNPINITAQWYTEAEADGTYMLGPVDLTNTYSFKSVICVLQMQTVEAKVFSSTGYVETAATYTVHPQDRLTLDGYISRVLRYQQPHRRMRRGGRNASQDVSNVLLPRRGVKLWWKRLKTSALL